MKPTPLAVTITRCKDCPLVRPVLFEGMQCSVTRRFIDERTWAWPGDGAPDDCPLRLPKAQVHLAALPPLTTAEQQALHEPRVPNP